MFGFQKPSPLNDLETLYKHTIDIKSRPALDEVPEEILLILKN